MSETIEPAAAANATYDSAEPTLHEDRGALKLADVQHFEELLWERSGEVATDLRRLERDASGLSENGSHERPEEAQRLEDLSETLRFLEHQREVDEEVGRALERISEGTYGRCETCGKWIDRDRLEVLPEARFCRRCEDAV